MYWDNLRRILARFRRALGIERRLTQDESHHLRQLAEAIVDYGRMIQGYFGQSMTSVMVEITELASRFRENPQTIEDALLLLSKNGRARADDRPGCWQVRLAYTSVVNRNQDDEEPDRGAA